MAFRDERYRSNCRNLIGIESSGAHDPQRWRAVLQIRPMQHDAAGEAYVGDVGAAERHQVGDAGVRV